jgi:DNA primase catalytic subunit
LEEPLGFIFRVEEMFRYLEAGVSVRYISFLALKEFG